MGNFFLLFFLQQILICLYIQNTLLMNCYEMLFSEAIEWTNFIDYKKV